MKKGHTKNVPFLGTLPKKGQIQITFNWIYVLIAGAVILLFFVSIVSKQKTVSEERLTQDVVRVMESIFVAAGVSEKTKNFIDTSGLARYTMQFDCSDGVGEYGIEDGSVTATNAIEPIFSPAELQTTKLIVWSLPYSLPYKIIDFLFVTSVNTKYYVLGNSAFGDDFLNSTAGFNTQKIVNLRQADPGRNFQVRIVDFGTIAEGDQVPIKLQGMDDDKVTAVSFGKIAEVEYATFYQMEDREWSGQGKVRIINGYGKRDAAKYAAIFSAGQDQYRCNMAKAFKRMDHVNTVYVGKLQEIETFYTQHPELPTAPYCLNTVRSNMGEAMRQQVITTGTCPLSETLELCSSLGGTASKVQFANTQLGVNCITLY